MRTPKIETQPPNTLLLHPEASDIVFFGGGEKEILRLDKDGMVYKGKRIEDAGEAHLAFLEVMNQIKKLP